jgi:hypothetical protein
VRFISAYIVLFVFLSASTLVAQESYYQVALYGSFTTSSKLFQRTSDADENIRTQFLPLNDIFSVGIDVRQKVEAFDIQIGLNVEYLSKTESFTVPISSNKTIPVIDGFTAIPVELSGFFVIPVGSEVFQIYMGGGGGVYLGSRRYEYAGANAITIERKPGYGIHILSGAQYRLTPTFSFRSEIKFRDVQFETVNRFTQPYTFYRGTAVTLDPLPFSSRITIDGMALNFGLVYHF